MPNEIAAKFIATLIGRGTCPACVQDVKTVVQYLGKTVVQYLGIRVHSHIRFIIRELLHKLFVK